MATGELASEIEAAFSDLLPLDRVLGDARGAVLRSNFKATIDVRLSRELYPESPELTVIRSRLVGRAALTLVRGDKLLLRFKVRSAGQDDRDRVSRFGRHVAAFLDEPAEHLLDASVAYHERYLEDTPDTQ